MTDHDAYPEMVAGYALDALGPEDRDHMAAHLAGCPDCQALLSDLRRVAAGIGASVDPVAPPPDLKEKTIAFATGRAASPAPAPTPVPAPTPPAAPVPAAAPVIPIQVAPAAMKAEGRSRRSGLVWLALAASMAAAVGLGLYARTLRTELASVRATLAAASSRAEALRAELASARQDATRVANTMGVLRSPDVLRVDLRNPATPEAPAARAFVSASRGLVFDAENLAPLAADRVYQLWIVPVGFGAAPVSAGLITTDAAGRAAMTLDFPAGVTAILALAVSEEPSGGSPQPTTRPFLVGRPLRN